MSCVSLLRYHLVPPHSHSLVPMNVSNNYASLTRRLVFPKLSAVSEMSRLFLDALWCQFVLSWSMLRQRKWLLIVFFFLNVCNISFLPVSLLSTPAMFKAWSLMLSCLWASPCLIIFTFHHNIICKHHCLIGQEMSPRCRVELFWTWTCHCSISCSGDNEPFSCSPHRFPVWNQN